MFTVSVAQEVALQNGRLNILYGFVSFLFSAWVIGRFVIDCHYFSYQKIGPEIYMMLWAGTLTEEMLDSIEGREVGLSCTKPYRFKYTHGHHFDFRPVGCLEVCRQGRGFNSSSNCVGQTALYKEGGMDKLAIVTSRSAHLVGTAHGPKEMLFSPYATALEIHMNIAYSFESTYFAFPSLRKKWRESQNFKNMLVAVVDSDGNVRKTISPGTDITFTLPDIFDLAGEPDDFLDTPNTHMEPNKDLDAHMQHPAPRVVGTIVVVLVHCSDYGEELAKNPLVRDAWSDEYDSVCRLGFHLRKDEMGMIESEDIVGLQGETISLTLGAMQLIVSPSGSFRYIDPDKIYSYLTDAMVIMSIPKLLVVFFLTSCLGHLSVVYSNALRRDFCINWEVSSMASRLLATDSAFERIATVSKDGHALVTREAIETRLKAIMETVNVNHDEPILDAQELAVYANFVWKTINRKNSRGSTKNMVAPDVMDTHLLFGATTSNETVDFESSISLFDLDRERRLFERIFTPSGLTAALQDMRECRREMRRGDCQVEQARTLHLEEESITPTQEACCQEVLADRRLSTQTTDWYQETLRNIQEQMTNYTKELISVSELRTTDRLREESAARLLLEEKVAALHEHCTACKFEGTPAEYALTCSQKDVEFRSTSGIVRQGLAPVNTEQELVSKRKHDKDVFADTKSLTPNASTLAIDHDLVKRITAVEGHLQDLQAQSGKHLSPSTQEETDARLITSRIVTVEARLEEVRELVSKHMLSSRQQEFDVQSIMRRIAMLEGSITQGESQALKVLAMTRSDDVPTRHLESRISMAEGRISVAESRFLDVFLRLETLGNSIAHSRPQENTERTSAARSRRPSAASSVISSCDGAVASASFPAGSSTSTNIGIPEGLRSLAVSEKSVRSCGVGYLMGSLLDLSEHTERSCVPSNASKRFRSLLHPPPQSLNDADVASRCQGVVGDGDGSRSTLQPQEMRAVRI
eukprot:TRINITY_DN38240_c0_g1_i1.p1 TRINITY_DN38240_c0_g1~~TRINITY_DN38240_c0_g1_i1.p1  ORF type:complete len:997 (-),score=130.80 TRINITY_DN38240_c0_g1_i1:50-2992(-)